MDKKELKIQLTGCSGVGKTTLAKWISQQYDIPFISGSYSDLVPETREQKHEEMISKSPSEIFSQDYRVLNLRNKLFSNHSQFVSDRSYIDSAAYMIQKLSHHIRECDMQHFINACYQLMEGQCTHLIFIPFSTKFLAGWEMEDNNKRVLNRYYQYEVSLIIKGILDLYGVKKDILRTCIINYEVYTLKVDEHKIKVLVLDELDFEKRQLAVERFLEL